MNRPIRHQVQPGDHHLRILHISTRLILGGSQENTVISCAGQADAGHDVALAFGPIYGPEGSLIEEVRSHGGIETIEVPNLVRQLAPVRDLRCRLELARVIRSFRPEIVHTHSSKAGILGRAAARAAGVPGIVHTIHGLPFHPYQSRATNRLYVGLERWAANKCDAIVCVADAMRDQALAEGVGRTEQYHTIYSGMDVESFTNNQVDRDAWRAGHGIGPEDHVIGTVARLAELKGHDDLLDAMGDRLKNAPRIKLLWVGDGYWADRLKRRVHEMGLERSVIFAGRLPPGEIPNVMHCIDVLAHPSWREGLPRTVPQALLSGTPVIANDVDGTSEVVIDGQTGRLVQPGDIAALEATLAGAIDDPLAEQSLAGAGRTLCLELFPARRMIDDLDRLYTSLLRKPRP